MGHMFIMSLIFAIASVLLIVPLNRKLSQLKGKWIFIALVFSIALLTGFSALYISKIDIQWTIGLYVLPVISLAGAIIATGLEQKIKSFIVFLSILAVVYLVSAPLFNAKEKYESAKMDEAVEIEPFEETETPASVPPKFAKNKMKKAFSQVPNTSYYELGNLQIQKVEGEYVYIAPVEFSGVFKWFQGKTTPGYFKLSATDSTANPQFIKEEMKYIPSAYLNQNLDRYMRMQYPTIVFYGDPQLEINDEGKPFYIRSYGEFISARNGFDVKGIVMVDAATGHTEKLAIKDVPSFIDGAVSPEAVSLQNSYYGNYIHGYWNSLLSKKDVKLPSDEGTEVNVSPVFDENGEMYYFTDFTSPKEGVDSMLGYALTNARTGKATYYTGNVEEAYMDSKGVLEIIEKKFIEKKWEGDMPLLYNFYGEASWLTPVLDSNGFLQNYFIVSAANQEISVYASTPNEALKLYKTALSKGTGELDAVGDAEEAQISGHVARVFKEKSDNSTIVYFLLESGENFIISTDVNPLAIYLEAGDSVQLTYLQTDEQFLPVKSITIEGVN